MGHRRAHGRADFQLGSGLAQRRGLEAGAGSQPGTAEPKWATRYGEGEVAGVCDTGAAAPSLLLARRRRRATLSSIFLSCPPQATELQAPAVRCGYVHVRLASGRATLSAPRVEK